MGKHERQLIEEAEKIIVKILNSQSLSDADKKNQWLDHASTVAKKIRRDFSKIDSVRHLGNRYDNTGDVLVVSNGNKFFIETKMSDTKSGVGTRANISQDALTKNSLFKGNVKSWSNFRKKKNHEKMVNEYLNQFSHYPQGILKIENSTNQKEEKAKYLRELKNKNNKKAESILGNIQKIDRKEKIEYLTYLSHQKQQSEMIKRFFALIMLGIHTKEALAGLMKRGNFFNEIQNLIIYYTNYHKGKITVKKEDVGKQVNKILKSYSDFKITFPKGVSHCKIVGIKGGSSDQLLQIVLHWKNIAQGIKTPCLNIFS